MLNISLRDLGLLHPAQDITALPCGWIAQGVGLVVVAQGATGVSAWPAHQALRVEPVTVEVVDTVGVGDTCQAALLAALAERGVLSEA